MQECVLVFHLAVPAQTFLVFFADTPDERELQLYRQIFDYQIILENIFFVK